MSCYVLLSDAVCGQKFLMYTFVLHVMNYNYHTILLKM